MFYTCISLIISSLYFSPTELDALVFGHIFTLLTIDLPNTKFAEIIRNYDNLVNFCTRVDKKYYKDLNNDY